MPFRRRLVLALPGLIAFVAAPARGAGSLSPRVREAVDMGRTAASTPRHVLVGLALRDRAGLDAFLAEVQDPASPRFRRFLTVEELTAAFGPTADAEAAVVAHLEASGLTVDERFPNRLLVGATGPTAAIERAFGVEMHDVVLRGNRRVAAAAEPALPDGVARYVTGVLGLDDLTRARHHSIARRVAAPRAALGQSCCHLGPADVGSLYDVPAGAGGTGVTLVVAGVFQWKDADVAAFDAAWGLPGPPGGASTQVCTGRARAPGCRFKRRRSVEATLDVELAHGMAPGARVVNYMAASRALAALSAMYNRIVADDAGDVVTTSWGACELDVAPAAQRINDDIFASANALGQSWFAASGDEGSADCHHNRGGHRRTPSVDEPANSPHVVGVGGTTPVCSGGLVPGDPACAGYGGESAWSGAGGGVSLLFARPAFQADCGVAAGTSRLVPDVALAADPTPGNYVTVGGRWFVIGGTSAATALWGGLFTRVVGRLGARVGAPAPRLYALCGTAAFHDVATGSNGAYAAGPGYDPVTGIGSPDVGALLSGF